MRLREQRCRKREAFLADTEQMLEKIGASVRAGTLKGRAEIGHRVGREANRRKVGKHFEITIGETDMSWTRRHESIAAEARFDGVCVIRTSLKDIGPDAAVAVYKCLSAVERAFRTARSHLRVRPVHACIEDRVRGHVFLCMLSYYVEWHMRRRLAPLLFEDDARAARGTRVTVSRRCSMTLPASR